MKLAIILTNDWELFGMEVEIILENQENASN